MARKHFKLENAYFAVDAVDFAITPGDVVRKRINGKLIMGCLDLWAVIYYLNYSREPISYAILMNALQCSKGYLRKMIKCMEQEGCLRIEEYQGKPLYRLISKQIVGSPDEPRGLCSEPPSSPDEPLRFTTRTDLNSKAEGEIKNHVDSRNLLRDSAPSPALQTSTESAKQAQRPSPSIHNDSEKKLRRSVDDLRDSHAKTIQRFEAVYGFTPPINECSLPMIQKCLEQPHAPISAAYLEMLKRHARAGSLPAQGM